MFIAKCSVVAISLAILTGGATVCFGQTGPTEPSPEMVAKLVIQLSSTEFRSRQQAREELEKLGAPVLPALRKAALANTDLEAKRRIEFVVGRIEEGLLRAEEKLWQDLDAPRRGIKNRLTTILARTPALSDQQVASVVYLLTVGRAPNGEEVGRAQKQFTQTTNRRANVLEFTRSLVQGKEFSAEVAAANGLVLKAQQDVATELELVQKLKRLNGPAFQKITDGAAAALKKTVKTDEAFIDLAFLLALSRFPAADESTAFLAHLKANRRMAHADIFWALMNSREFLLAP